MSKDRKVVAPKKSPRRLIPKIKQPDQNRPLNVNFSKFKIKPICITGRFNNHFKNYEHFNHIVVGFLGTVLPKITSHTYSEICEGGSENRILHFHTIDDQHREIVREILKAYNFKEFEIDQMMEGDDLFNLSAILGHSYPARLVCHKIENVLYFLFLDTNHHIYMNTKFTEETLFYETCPQYISGKCYIMPIDCYAVGYLDEKKLKETFSYNNSFED